MSAIQSPKVCVWNCGRAANAMVTVFSGLGADIILLQECRREIALSGYRCFVSIGDERGAGVAALWRTSINCDVKVIVPGRIIALDIMNVTLFNVYAPNTTFRTDSERSRRREECDAILWKSLADCAAVGRGIAAMGDFNCCYSFGDHYTHAQMVFDPSKVPRPEAQRLIAGVKSLALEDVGAQHAVSGCPRFTYFSKSGGARYDYIFAQPGIFSNYSVLPLKEDHSILLAW